MADQLTFMMQQVLPYVWSKHGLLKQMPASALSDEGINSLRRAVHVHTFVTCKEWEKYLRRHSRAMIRDQASFCRYTAFACYLEIETYKSDFDRCIRLIALVSYFALHCYGKGAKTAYLHAEPLLERFFYFEMSHLEADIAFWKELNYFIMRKGYFELHLAVEKMLLEDQPKKQIVRLVLESSVFTNPASPDDPPSKKPIASMHDSELLSNIEARTVESHFLSHQLVCAVDKMVHRDLREEVYAQKKLSFREKLENSTCVGEELGRVSLQIPVFKRYLDMAKADLEYKYTMKRRMLEVPLMKDMDVQKVSDVLRSIQNPTIAVD